MSALIASNAEPVFVPIAPTVQSARRSSMCPSKRMGASMSSCDTPNSQELKCHVVSTVAATFSRCRLNDATAPEADCTASCDCEAPVPSSQPQSLDTLDSDVQECMQPMSVDHPKKKTCSCAETKAARGASWKIRNYTVHDAAPLGSGGLGEVFRAVHQGGRIVALKVGNSMAWKDFTWSTSRNEWNVYVALGLGRGITWLPDVYQYGLRSTGQGMAPWLSMELLGPSFYDLSEAAQPDPMPELRNFACSAVNALRALHCRGFLHRDVKPENIMTRVPRVFNKIPDVVLVDFGMAVQWLPGATRPKPRFAGTPDYASAAAMREEELGPCDDLESLGYTLLFMWSGRLPWPSLPDELPQRSGGGSGWTRTELASMAASREQHWEKSVASEQIPRWLDDWITHCQSLSPLEVPDYEALTKLIPSKQVLPVEKESVLGVKMAEIEACWPEE